MRQNRMYRRGMTLLIVFLFSGLAAAAPETPPSPGLTHDAVGPAGGDASRRAPIEALEAPAPLRRPANILGPRAPIEIRSEEALRALYPEAAVQALKEKISFDQQVLLLFVWRGSGEDRLEYRVAESRPERVFFTYTPGQARDVHLHVRLFAIRRDVLWTPPHVPRPADPVIHDRPDIGHPPVMRE